MSMSLTTELRPLDKSKPIITTNRPLDDLGGISTIEDTSGKMQKLSEGQGIISMRDGKPTYFLVHKDQGNSKYLILKATPTEAKAIEELAKTGTERSFVQTIRDWFSQNDRPTTNKFAESDTTSTNAAQNNNSTTQTPMNASNAQQNATNSPVIDATQELQNIIAQQTTTSEKIRTL